MHLLDCFDALAAYHVKDAEGTAQPAVSFTRYVSSAGKTRLVCNR